MHLSSRLITFMLLMRSNISDSTMLMFKIIPEDKIFDPLLRLFNIFEADAWIFSPILQGLKYSFGVSIIITHAYSEKTLKDIKIFKKTYHWCTCHIFEMNQLQFLLLF